MSLCVYAVIASNGGRPGTTGLAGERLRAVSVGSLSAIVGEIGRPPRPTEASLRKYDRVISRLAGRSSAILPARYGTVFRDLDELSLMLGSRQQPLRRQLQVVRNRVQMTIRLVVPEGADPPVGPATPPHRGSAAGTPVSGRPGEPDRVRPTRATSGAAYLRERVAAAARSREIPGFDPVRAAVRRWVREERVERHNAVASVYHLIPQGSVDQYRRAVERAARAAGLRLVISGPWPPYAFASPF